VGLVLLDLHPTAAAIAALAAREICVQVGLGQLEPGGNAVDDGGERFPVGLAGREEAERPAHEPSLARGDRVIACQPRSAARSTA